MNLPNLRQFFRWCTILNGTVLIIWSLLIRFASPWVFDLHHSWIPITAEFYPNAIYLLLGVFKICFIAFNLVPYITLVIIGRKQGCSPP